MDKILMLGPDPKACGGISSVIDTYNKSGLFDNDYIYFISTSKDGLKYEKIKHTFRSFIKVLFILNSFSLVHIHVASRNSFLRKCFFIVIFRLFKKSYIFHLHGGGFSKFYWHECGKLKKYIIRWALNNAVHIIFLSSPMKEDIAKISSNSSVSIVPNPVILPELQNIQKKTNSLLFLGHLTKSKGVFDLIDAVATLKPKFPDLVLFLAGKGEERLIKNKIDQLHLTENIKLLGWIRDDQKDFYLRNTQIFVLPSYVEALPMSLLEAMSYKMAIVASNVGGIPSVVMDDCEGLLILPGRKKELVDALEKLLSSEYLRRNMGEKAREKVEREFNIENIKLKLIELYKSVKNQ